MAEETTEPAAGEAAKVEALIAGSMGDFAGAVTVSDVDGGVMIQYATDDEDGMIEINRLLRGVLPDAGYNLVSDDQRDSGVVDAPDRFTGQGVMEPPSDG